MDFHGFSWLFSDFHRFFVGFHGFSRFNFSLSFVDFHGIGLHVGNPAMGTSPMTSCWALGREPERLAILKAQKSVKFRENPWLANP